MSFHKVSYMYDTQGLIIFYLLSPWEKFNFFSTQEVPKHQILGMGDFTIKGFCLKRSLCKNHEHDLVFTALNAIPIYTIAIKYVAWIYVVPSVEMGQFFFALRFFGQRQKILRSHRLIFQRWLGSMIILLIMLGFDPTQWPIPNMWWLCTVLSGQFQKLHILRENA